MSYPPQYTMAPSPLDSTSPTAPIYTVLIIGLVLFMASNVMPNLLPDPSKIGNVAPSILMCAFAIILLALLTQMLGILPGVPSVHITYVHLTIASLLFFLMWNHIVADRPPEPKQPSSSSSSSSSKEEEKKEEKKKEREPEPEPEPTPWDDLRAHPSAFLTTRLNRVLPWPFPMGHASNEGPELWWESGTPVHVGHFNKPDFEAIKAAEEEEKKQTKENEAKEKEKAKAKEKEKATLEVEKEAEMEKRKKEEEAKKRAEMEKAKIAAVEAAKKKAVYDRQKQKLWRTKFLAMIIGVSLLNKNLGFLLLLFFSLQLVSQELNTQPLPPGAGASASPSASAAVSMGSGEKESSSSSSASSKPSDAEKEKMAKLQAMKEKEEEKGKDTDKSKDKEKEKDKSKDKGTEQEKGKEASSSSSSVKPSSSSAGKPDSSRFSTPSKPKPSSSSSSSAKDSSGTSTSSSSSSESKPVTGAAVREAAGTKTVTHAIDSSVEVPYQVGIGMHYIHTSDKWGKLDYGSSFIPSEGMAHPLMTTNYRGYAN